MSDREMELGTVPVFDEGAISDSKEQAVKVLEEASEVLEAWKAYDRSRGVTGVRGRKLSALGGELADVVQAACNLAFACGIDLRLELDACYARNRERGRVS